MTIDPNNKVFIEAIILHKTEKAIRIEFKTEEIWLPKSVITYDDDAEFGQMTDIEIPIWLARKNGIL